MTAVLWDFQAGQAENLNCVRNRAQDRISRSKEVEALPVGTNTVSVLRAVTVATVVRDVPTAPADAV